MKSTLFYIFWDLENHNPVYQLGIIKIQLMETLIKFSVL